MDTRKISELKGVGDKSEKLFNKIGIFCCEDLKYYFPRDYIEYKDYIVPSDEYVDDKVTLKAYIITKPLLKRIGKFNLVTCKIKALDMEINVKWYNMPYLAKSLKVGSLYAFNGYLYRNNNCFYIDQPSIFTISQYDEIKNTLQPVYSLTKGLSNNQIKKTVKQVVGDNNSNEYKMHFPKDYAELKEVRSEFVYEEFFMYILRLRYLKDNNVNNYNSFNIYPSAQNKRIIETLPYKLTNAQTKVWTEIEECLSKNVSMNRLVQGDVGSGKTIIAFLAAIMVASSGYQCAIMAPTEILASQHFSGIKALLKNIGSDIECVLLTGSMTAKSKREIGEQINSGIKKIIIGTHALFQEKVEYNNLALVITDEQHRFGVKQREELLKKNNSDIPHLLVMSATPIPRSLALILYGDLDISIIDEVPAKRLPVKNSIVNTDYRNKVYEFINKEIKSGHQAYVICPLVEESEGIDAKDVISYTKELRDVFSNDINIACLHGKMKQQDKNRIMNDFYNNDIQILVSTTVVEVGVNVPNATVMFIEGSERFGLAQLHQLRGRIGRGDAQSYCIFMSGNRKKTIMDRLQILKESNDGFVIASKDLEMRGPGDLFGIRQSGEMQFRIADIFNDAAVLKKASEDVDKILENDPELKKEENKEIKSKLDKLLENDLYIGL